MTTAHTPGPWKTRDSSHENHGIVRGGSGNNRMEVDIDGCCAEANTRLIAAAPELLAALVDLIPRCMEAGVGCSQAQDAVANATGGAA
jgi:hypothetical protein